MTLNPKSVAAVITGAGTITAAVIAPPIYRVAFLSSVALMLAIFASFTSLLNGELP
jgi:hypothetical protein